MFFVVSLVGFEKTQKTPPRRDQREKSWFFSSWHLLAMGSFAAQEVLNTHLDSSELPLSQHLRLEAVACLLRAPPTHRRKRQATDVVQNWAFCFALGWLRLDMVCLQWNGVTWENGLFCVVWHFSRNEEKDAFTRQNTSRTCGEDAFGSWNSTSRLAAERNRCGGGGSCRVREGVWKTDWIPIVQVYCLKMFVMISFVWLLSN